MPVPSRFVERGPAAERNNDITLDGNIGYATISKTLTELLKDKPVSSGGKTIHIVSVAAS